KPQDVVEPIILNITHPGHLDTIALMTYDSLENKDEYCCSNNVVQTSRVISRQEGHSNPDASPAQASQKSYEPFDIRVIRNDIKEASTLQSYSEDKGE
ncbi:hypothetical protein MMC14_006142, partial [Varicellaria rhodocarpa]|nr:hypothetical protein [Varicellaria rhodocarpa]